MTTIKRGFSYKDIPFSQDVVLKTTNEKINNWITSENGFCRGTNIFWTGTPGAGKSTLLTTILNSVPDEHTVFYSREMVLSQLKQQLGNVVNHENAEFVGQDNCPTFKDFIAYLWESKPSIAVVDSLQAIAEIDYHSVGTDSLDAACLLIASELKKWAEQTNGIVILIGQVNKDGSFAGKNTIMHLIDIHVQQLKNEKTETCSLSFGKNRKGDTKKILYYEFVGKGQIALYTEEEWNDKQFSKQAISFLDAIEQVISAYEKIASGKPREKEFRDQLKVVKTQIKKRVGDHKGGYIGEMVTYLNALLSQYEIN